MIFFEYTYKLTNDYDNNRSVRTREEESLLDGFNDTDCNKTVAYR